jgi:hypothetical protein
MRKVGGGGLALSALLLSGSVVVAADPEPKAKPEVVTLGFAWPTVLGADVTYRWTRTSTGKPAQGVTVVGRLNVAPEGENLRVEYADWKREPTGRTATGEPPVAPEKLVDVVDKRGALVRIDGEAPALVKTVAARTWQMLVGSWAGVELKVGKEYVATVEGPVPVVPGGKLKTTLRFRVERLLDCPGSPVAKCVELKLRSEPDHKSMAKLAAAMTPGEKDKGAPNSSDILEGVEEATLVTEPDRLIPHRLTITKTVSLGRPSREDPDGRSQVDRTTWTYDYTAATGQAPAK